MQDFMTELKEQRIWFHWIWEKNKDGNLTKVPKSSRGGSTGTTDNWSRTWATYAEAEATLAERKADGLAFKIPDGYFFLDADDYPLDDPLIQMLLNRFNSYTERSVSGGGIHIYGKCDPAKIPFTTIKKAKRNSMAHIMLSIPPITLSFTSEVLPTALPYTPRMWFGKSLCGNAPTPCLQHLIAI